VLVLSWGTFFLRERRTPPLLLKGLLKEIVDPALISWNIWRSYPYGFMPKYDESAGAYSSFTYPDGLSMVYMYLIFGEQQYLDYAAKTLRFTANLTNSHGVLMLATQNGTSLSTEPIDATELALAIIDASYIAELEPSTIPWLKGLGNAALKFQSAAGLFGNKIDADGRITDATDHFGTRCLGTALLRVYEVTGEIRYLVSALRLLDELWSLRDPRNLVWDQYDAESGHVLDYSVRCHGQWQFLSLAEYAYLSTRDSKYQDMYEKALGALHSNFWSGTYWNYRLGYELLEYNQPLVVTDLLGMGEYVNLSMLDIKTRIIDGTEISRLNLLIHATSITGTPVYNTNTHCFNQMGAVQNAWAYASGFDRALELYRALITYQRKSHGFIDGVNALNGQFYHSFGTDLSRLRVGMWISWEATLLLLKVENGDVKFDFGHGFTMPFRLGLAYGPTLVDPDKFRVNLAERSVEVTVLSGRGQIDLGLNIRMVLKNSAKYDSFKDTEVTFDGPGSYRICF
jgi:hypothetical protein